MALSDKKKQNLMDSLRKSGAVSPDDSLIDAGYANYIQFGIGGFLLQRPKPGFACFTQEKFIWTGAGDDIIVPYSQIKELNKCLIMLMPMGIKISYQSEANGKLMKKKFSIWSRNKWLALMAEKAKISCP